MPTTTDLPTRVRRLRRRLDLTQERFAARMGVSVITIHRWEAGQSAPRRLALARLAELETEAARHTAQSRRAAPPGGPAPLGSDIARAHPVLDFNGDPDRFALFAECLRLTRGYEFNPAFASEISRIDPLPHQRIAVYDHMLAQDPLRFLLADDAGAGKTIMTGLYAREMLMRGRLRRILVVPPAGLVGNWRRELRTLFRLEFRIVSGADARHSNPFAAPEGDLAIVSLDTIRGPAAFAALADPETPPYDLVVFDEAHKLSASRRGDRARRTQRYRLAEALSGCPPAPEYAALEWHCRHLLLLTATPHMGKDSPYHHLWRLLDHQVFGTEKAFARFPPAARARHFIRRTKEEMVDLKGRPIFRARRCETFGYDLSKGPGGERDLYDRTTAYLRDSYGAIPGNRQAVKLAMGVFQRRLASSTWALLRSFERRAAKIERLVDDLESGRIDARKLRAAQQRLDSAHAADHFDEHDAADDLADAAGADPAGPAANASAPAERNEDYEDAVLGAVVAVAVKDLREELATLQDLGCRARALLDSGHESKFERLRELLESPAHAADKWLVFSEHRDTVDHLVRRLEALGHAGRVASIHGGLAWDEREEHVERFRDPSGARFLVATDAAGEGINLQFCRLMVNYDIPWNPARLEQRMGRIHRYGQQSDVRIVNLVSSDTREGRVLTVLLERLESIRKELSSDKVFDVIGRLFENRSLREHINDALTAKGEQRARALIENGLTTSAVRQIRVTEERRYGKTGDVARRLGPLRGQIQRERYLHLLPAYVMRFVEMSAPLLGLGIRGDLGAFFRLIPERPGALDPLLAPLETHPPEARERLRIRCPDPAHDPCIWLHPGEPVFDAMCERVAAMCRSDAQRGAIFADPRTKRPYLLHLGEAGVEEEFARADIPERRPVERRLVVLRQSDEGIIEPSSLERAALLLPAPSVPPGSVPLASRALSLRAEAAAHLDGESRRAADSRRREAVASLPRRRSRVVLNFNLRAAELAQRRIDLSRNRAADAAAELDAVKREQRELAERRRAALEDLDAAPDRIVPAEPRFLAHALVVPPTGGDDEDARNAPVEKIAMGIAAEWERSRGAKVTDVSRPPGARAAGLHDHPGFDLLAEYGDGRRRHIEVKGRAGRDGVWMELNEWKAACNLGREYWLYVALDCATPEPRLQRVRDPFSRLFAKTSGRVRISAKEVESAAEADG